MIAWFKALDGAGKAAMIGLALLLAVIAVGTAIHFVDAAFSTAEQRGAVAERAEAQGKTIENLEKARAAKDHYRGDAAVRDADCLRDATNPADC